MGLVMGGIHMWDLGYIHIFFRGLFCASRWAFSSPFAILRHVSGMLPVGLAQGGCPVPVGPFPSSFPALRHVSGLLPAVLTQGVVLYRSLLPLHLCCPQACVRYVPCGISPGGCPVPVGGQTPFPRFTFAPSLPNSLRSCFSYPDF